MAKKLRATIRGRLLKKSSNVRVVIFCSFADLRWLKIIWMLKALARMISGSIAIELRYCERIVFRVKIFTK